MAMRVLEPNSYNTMDEAAHSETVVAVKELISVDAIVH